jgi:hypothetical protein
VSTNEWAADTLARIAAGEQVIVAIPIPEIDTSPEAVQAHWEAHAQAVADATGHPCVVTAPAGAIHATPREGTP